MNHPSSADHPNRGQVTILLVEDEILIRAALADDLRSQGYAVIEAASAEQALAVLRSSVAVDLMLTDVQMPGPLDGFALARLVRAERGSVKVVIGSGRVPDPGLIAEADAFFSKPYDWDRLLARIRELLRQEP